MAECELDELFDDTDAASSGKEWVVKQPVQGEIRKEGAAVFRGTLRCGKISYFTHWTPAAILVSCEIHSGNCYATTPILDGCDEDQLVQWVGDAASFKTGSDHLKFLPKGCYNQRTPAAKRG